MITIESKVSSIWIYPFISFKKANELGTLPTCKKLINLFTDWEEIYGKPGMRRPVFNFTYCMDEENKIFKVPIGFGVDNVLNMIRKENPDEKIEVIYNNYCYSPRRVKIKLRDGVKPRTDIQYDAISFLTNEIQGNQKFLSLATGFGKTFCVIYSIYKKKVPALIISSKLSRQWISQITKFLDIHPNQIYEIRGKESIDNLMRKKSYNEIFYICSTTTLHNRLKQDVDLDKVFNRLGIGIKVFDEAHEFYKTNCEIDCNSSFKETYYLTATPMRSDTKENLRYVKMFAKVPIFGVETHYTNKNYIIYLINYNSKPSSIEVRHAMRWKRNMLNAHVCAKQTMKTDRRKVLFLGMIKMYIDKVRTVSSGKIMIVLTSLEQISELMNFLSKFKTKDIIRRYDSTVKHEDRNDAKNADIIITTFGIAYAGLDIENLSSVFSISPFHTAVGTSQLLGRLSRNVTNDVYFLDFLDEGYPRMHIQRQNRLKELKPRAKKIYKNTVTENSVISYLESIYKG